MSKSALYAASAPMFVIMLNNLNTWLDKAEAHAAAKKFDIEVLMQARLAPDMLSLAGQISLATAFAKNAMCRLAGQTPPDFPDTDKTLADYRARIARALDIVQSIAEADFAGAEERAVSVRVGPDATINASGSDYFYKFGLPNFYFHMTAAYALLRHNGVELGKKDFLAGTLPR